MAMPQSPQNAKRAANPAVIYNPLHTSGDVEVEPHPPALHEKVVLGIYRHKENNNWYRL